MDRELKELRLVPVWRKLLRSCRALQWETRTGIEYANLAEYDVGAAATSGIANGNGLCVQQRALERVYRAEVGFGRTFLDENRESDLSNFDSASSEYFALASATLRFVCWKRSPRRQGRP